jgi:hypothetical protein
MYKNNEIWFEQHYHTLASSCETCNETEPMMTDQVLTEMFQKNLIKPEDLSQMNDPAYPEDKKRLLMSLLAR